MNETAEDKIRERAYQLWKEAGEPKEGEQDFWLKAEKEHKEKGVAPPAEASSEPNEKGRGDSPSSEER
jgi:hypothetical protein